MKEQRTTNLPVVITSLAMRFNKKEGWTEELLSRYLRRGALVLRGFGTDEQLDQYWILEVDSSLDVERMFEDGVVGEVRCKDQYGETRDLSDVDAMKSRNW